MTMTEQCSECPVMGPDERSILCPRHGIKKYRHWVDLCRQRGDYWDAWEAGRGPGQFDGSPPLAGGPGTELKRLIAYCAKRLPWWDMAPKKGCRCEATAIWMDELGCDGCEAKIEKILDKLMDEAKERKIKFPFQRVAAKKLIRHAIRRARKKENRA